jgi:hypothetical protein
VQAVATASSLDRVASCHHVTSNHQENFVTCSCEKVTPVIR